MAVTLQALDVTVLVIARNLLRKAVRVAADVRAFTVNGGSQAAQPVVGKLIPPYRAFVACLPSQAADVSAILRCTAARVIVQVLRQLAPADARQPAADIVIVRLLVGCAAVKEKLCQQPFETDSDSESRLLA